MSLDSRPYLFRIMTTEKYNSETAAARMLITMIWRMLVFRIRGHPAGEMLKCQEAGKRQEMPILKFQKTDFKATCSSLLLTYTDLKVKPSAGATPVSLTAGSCISACLILFCSITHHHKLIWLRIEPWGLCPFFVVPFSWTVLYRFLSVSCFVPNTELETTYKDKFSKIKQ